MGQGDPWPRDYADCWLSEVDPLRSFHELRSRPAVAAAAAHHGRGFHDCRRAKTVNTSYGRLWLGISDAEAVHILKAAFNVYED